VRPQYILVVDDSTLRFFVGGGDKDAALSSTSILELIAMSADWVEMGQIATPGKIYRLQLEILRCAC